MNVSEVELPPNRSFGVFFAVIFFIVATYFYYSNNNSLFYLFIVLGVFILLIALTHAEHLLIFNKLWMRLGLILGLIISPIVLGIIYFGIFTPIAIVMRLIGRDELRLKLRKMNSHWIRREPDRSNTSFKNQF